MALGTLPVMGLLVGLYVLYKTFKAFDYWRRERYFIRTKGTKRPHRTSVILPLGIDRFFIMVEYHTRQLLPDFIRSVHDREGDTFEVDILAQRTMSTREPRNIQALLATQFKDFELGPVRHGVFFPLLGDGIFTLDNKGWEHSRALLRPQFSRDQISHLESLERHVRIMFQSIHTDGRPTELQDLFFRLTLDTATEFLFGESVESLSGGMKDLVGVGNQTNKDTGEMGFAEAFNVAQDQCLKRIRARAFWWMVNPPEFKQSTDVCKKFVEHFVDLALKQPAYTKDGAIDEKESGKPKYVFLNALARETRNPILLRDQVMNVLLAGRDTTASLLGWTFYLLARHPEVEKKLRQAIAEHFGDEDRDKVLTFEALKSCNYLKWVVNETLRLYPVVPFNSRSANKDTTLPVGGGPDGQSPVFIPKGMVVEYSVYSMHRRTDLWGPDAACFRPERWGESRKSQHNGFDYLPFNGGPRICLGQQFALTEASYTIVRMLQHYKRMENCMFDPEVKYNATLTMCPGGDGVVIKMFRE